MIVNRVDRFSGADPGRWPETNIGETAFRGRAIS